MNCMHLKYICHVQFISNCYTIKYKWMKITLIFDNIKKMLVFVWYFCQRNISILFSPWSFACITGRSVGLVFISCSWLHNHNRNAPSQWTFNGIGNTLIMAFRDDFFGSICILNTYPSSNYNQNRSNHLYAQPYRQIDTPLLSTSTAVFYFWYAVLRSHTHFSLLFSAICRWSPVGVLFDWKTAAGNVSSVNWMVGDSAVLSSSASQCVELRERAHCAQHTHVIARCIPSKIDLW